MKYIAQCNNLSYEVTKEQAFEIIQPYPQVTIEVFNDNGTEYGRFGCVYATQVEINRQIEHKN